MIQRLKQAFRKKSSTKGTFLSLPAKEQKRIVLKAADGAIKDQQKILKMYRSMPKSK
jgi:hypothetical protein